MTGPKTAVSAATLVALTATGGCFLVDPADVPAGFSVTNRREDLMTIEVLGVDPPLKRTVTSGTQQITSTDGCVGTGAVASDPSGVTIARIDVPLCGGQVWIFEYDGSISLVRTSGDPTGTITTWPKVTRAPTR